MGEEEEHPEMLPETRESSVPQQEPYSDEPLEHSDELLEHSEFELLEHSELELLEHSELEHLELEVHS